LATLVTCLALVAALAQERPQEAAKESKPARDKALTWLTQHQAADGSWGKQYKQAITAFACLAYLGAVDEPFAGPHAKPLTKGLEYLLSCQKDGTFVPQGHSWIHGQGFATLALSEARGRALLCKTKPDLDVTKLGDVVTKAIKVIGDNQSHSGGWWYTQGAKEQHEGSTTVCAVQALVSADNFGIAIDKQVLAKGFDYLKKCQTPAGGFNYQLGDGQNMKEGTAAGVATLGLMRQFDTDVMIKGYQFLLQLTPAGISVERFPYYGHFYGCMGMQLLGQEFKEDPDTRNKTQAYVLAAQKEVVSFQKPDGSFELKGWMREGQGEDAGYSTAFAALLLGVPEGRLSIYNRTPPKLPAN
jgi:hypothetical protein